jgi:uroporphyrinogen-III synthase
MAANSSLAAWNVLVTRPEEQAQQLCNLISQAGGQAIAFPAIEIVPIPIVDMKIVGQDIIIFVSRNAVAYFADKIRDSVSESVLLVSVGAGSAESMRAHDLRVDIQPEQSIGSEGLLMMPEFADMTGKKVLIVRGKGGRELLADTLVQRGAEVQYIEVYERVLPSPTVQQCEQALMANCVVCTSVAGVHNLSLLLQKSLKILLDKPMLVMSERIKDYAVSLGFQRVMVTDTSSDYAVIEQLTKMDIE